MTVSKNQERTNTIKCIEKRILDQPLSDHRKHIIWRILSLYLLNVKKLPKEEAYSVMKEWLDKCDKLERLNFNSKIKIKRKVSQKAFIIVMAMTAFVTYIFVRYPKTQPFWDGLGNGVGLAAFMLIIYKLL
jgi:hypothetical protein